MKMNRDLTRSFIMNLMFAVGAKNTLDIEMENKIEFMMNFSFEHIPGLVIKTIVTDEDFTVMVSAGWNKLYSVVDYSQVEFVLANEWCELLSVQNFDDLMEYVRDRLS